MDCHYDSAVWVLSFKQDCQWAVLEIVKLEDKPSTIVCLNVPYKEIKDAAAIGFAFHG